MKPDLQYVLRTAARSLRRGVPQLVEHALPGLGGIDAQIAEGLRGKVPARVALGCAQQAEQQVLGADVVVVQGPGLPERERQRLLRLPGQRDPPDPVERALACQRDASEAPYL